MMIQDRVLNHQVKLLALLGECHIMWLRNLYALATERHAVATLRRLRDMLRQLIIGDLV